MSAPSPRVSFWRFVSTVLALEGGEVRNSPGVSPGGIPRGDPPEIHRDAGVGMGGPQDPQNLQKITKNPDFYDKASTELHLAHMTF